MQDKDLSKYFYGDEAMQFSYFRIPRQLITHPRFKSLSADAKLLYGLLLDHMGLSIKNKWYDSDMRVYIYYTVDEVCIDLNCGRDKGMKLLAELDTSKGVGLIERVRQGQARPNLCPALHHAGAVAPAGGWDEATYTMSGGRF